MDIKHLRIHKLKVDDGTTELVQSPQQGTEFHTYLSELLEEIIASESSRRFKSRSATTQVISIITDATINENFNGDINDVAGRLIKCEQEAQARIARMHGKIKPGILIQACFEHQNLRKYILCKTEDAEFIENAKYARLHGYPVAKKIIKSCVVTFDEDGLSAQILITDSNGSLAPYWWSEFLELDKYHTDEHNTTQAFSAVDKVLSTIKKKHPADYFQLRNSVINPSCHLKAEHRV